MNENEIKLQFSTFTEEEKNDIIAFCEANNMSIQEFLRKSVLFCLYKQVFHREMKQIGQFLLADQVITHEQLTTALVQQNETGELLGSVMINLGYLDEETLSRYLEIQILDI